MNSAHVGAKKSIKNAVGNNESDKKYFSPISCCSGVSKLGVHKK